MSGWVDTRDGDMATDDNDLKPRFDVKRRTTKVNIGIIVGVVVFFLVTGLLLLLVWHNPPDSPDDVTKEVNP